MTGALLGTHCQRVQHTHDVPWKVMAEKHSRRTRDPRVQSNHCGDRILPFRGRGCGRYVSSFWRTTSSSRAGYPAYTFRAYALSDDQQHVAAMRSSSSHCQPAMLCPLDSNKRRSTDQCSAQRPSSLCHTICVYGQSRRTNFRTIGYAATFK